MWRHPILPGPGIRDVAGAWLVCLMIAAGCLGLTVIAGLS